ncbi:MAG: hypothetical protein U0234_00735 [Sandaracinus sp.]
MPKPRNGGRSLARKRVHRTRFVELDGDLYLIGDRDAEGFEAVKLDATDAALVRRMRDDNEIEMESAVLARRR